TAERTAALAMLDRRRRGGRATLGADRGFVAGLRERGVTPHVAQHDRNRRSAVDGRTTRHPGYAVSQRRRKRVEEVFGWGKTVGGLRKLRYLGRARNELCLKLTATAYNLVRMAKLETTPA
ncbi:MAG: transposase, partial [Dehalococcoidia bacterium]